MSSPTVVYGIIMYLNCDTVKSCVFSRCDPAITASYEAVMAKKLAGFNHKTITNRFQFDPVFSVRAAIQTPAGITTNTYLRYID